MSLERGKVKRFPRIILVERSLIKTKNISKHIPSLHMWTLGIL